MSASTAPKTDPQSLLRQAIGPACHELRSPLAVVYGFARMMENTEGLSDEARAKYVAQIVKGAERLDQMLEDLSTIGRIAAARTQPKIEPTSVRAVIDGLAAMSANEQRVRVDQGAEVNVKADPSWLTESLQAVIDGLCFEEGIDVHIMWRHEAHQVQIQIIPNSTFPMIDVEPEKSSLGISLARIRVVSMGGSFDGSGDRVVVTLPRA